MRSRSWILTTVRAAFLVAAGLLVGHSPASGQANELGRQATQLREKIKERQAEINRLLSQREELERLAHSQKRELMQYEIQFRHYLANLESSEKRAQALERELLTLLEQARERDVWVHLACQTAGENAVPGSETLRYVALSVAADLYQRELRDRPVREQLQKKIDEEQAYQNRIRERYMANDQVRRDRIEKELASAQDTAKANLEIEQQIAAELQELRNRLNALDGELERLRKQSETKVSRSPARQPPFQPGQPFARLKGRLPWPAPGKIVRGYGPFTHPTLGVKLENKGIDVSVEPATRIRAVADGSVLYVGVLEHYGPIVALDHGGGYLTVYGNVETRGLKVGQVVSAGGPIGTVGQSERGEDPLYHFEIRHGDRALDPSDWMAR